VVGAGGGGSPLSVLLNLGADKFADVAAALAAREAALQYRNWVNSWYNDDNEWARFVSRRPRFNLSAPLGGSLEPLGGIVRGLTSTSIVGSCELVPGYCAEACRGHEVSLFILCDPPDSHRDNGDIHLRLSCREPKAALTLLDLGVLILDGGRPGIYVRRFVSALQGTDTASIGLAAELAEAFGEWGGPAAKIAAEVLAALLSAAHEVERASRIQTRGTRYPAVKEAADEARSEAFNAYWVASDPGPRPTDLGKLWIAWGLTAQDVLDEILGHGGADRVTRRAYEKAGEHIREAVRAATAYRAVAEALASLSEP